MLKQYKSLEIICVSLAQTTQMCYSLSKTTTSDRSSDISERILFGLTSNKLENDQSLVVLVFKIENINPFQKADLHSLEKADVFFN